MPLINKKKLNADFKKSQLNNCFFTVIDNPLDLTIYTGTPVVFYYHKILYWQH